MNHIGASLTPQQRRTHFVPEWATLRGLSQADLARELGADKSVVSRWFSGTTPGVEYRERLSQLFGCTVDALFRSPDDEWLASFIRGRDPDEIDRIKKTLEAAFPRR